MVEGKGVAKHSSKSNLFNCLFINYASFGYIEINHPKVRITINMANLP